MTCFDIRTVKASGPLTGTCAAIRFDRSYAQKHGLATAGTFDKIYRTNDDGEWEEISPYKED